ncbi:MAG TPA: sugar phosphate isomerase/epimerase [Armatimonadetes bacterium]|nr:sugar phosphate isomerase/epimerase [Armatimonadota bacterium]
MKPPILSWSPLRYIASMIERGEPGFEAWFAQARGYGLHYLEMHYRVPPRDPAALRDLRRLLDRYELSLSQFICTPDFTHPDRAYRDAQLEFMRENLAVARALGAVGCRVTAGCGYEEVSTEQGIAWAAEYLQRLGDLAEKQGLKLGFENHYRDRYYGPRQDFCFHAEVFLAVFERIKDSPVGVNFDCSNQLMGDEDPLAVLEVVKPKVWHVHASDRPRGRYEHSVIGEGDVPFDALFQTLADSGYQGFISLEDGNPEGDAGTERGLAFLRRKIAQYWTGCRMNWADG